MKKIVLLTLALVLFSTAVVVGFVRPAVADELIYIRSDGSVDPPTAPIQRVKNVYTLTGDVNAIRVQRNNIILDGNEHKISGAGASPVILARIPSITGVRNVTIKNLIITGGDMGITLDRCSNVTISGNVIRGTRVSVPELQATGGIYVWAGNSNVISGNRIENNMAGIYLGYETTHNIIVENNITNNIRGIQFWEASGNTFYHNNFINNTIHVYDVGVYSPDWASPSVNIWDNGYPSGGNYWSDYNGTDNNGDGIGDTPYVIDENNQDNYPLMDPVIIPEFPTWTTTLLILIVLTVAIATYKRRLLKKPTH